MYIVQDLIDMTLKKMDIDKDGRICYEDFETTVGDTLSHLQSFGDLQNHICISSKQVDIPMKIEQEPLLLEAFGPCLPRAEALHKFFQQVDHKFFGGFHHFFVFATKSQVMEKPDGIKSIRNFFLGLT